MKTLDELKNEVAKEYGYESWNEWGRALSEPYGRSYPVKAWEEVCRRAQLECARETLKEASKKARVEYKGPLYADPSISERLIHPDGSIFSIVKSSITNEANIKLIQ